MRNILQTAFRSISSSFRPGPARPSVTVAARRTKPANVAMPELAATIASALGKPEATPPARRRR